MLNQHYTHASDIPFSVNSEIYLFLRNIDHITLAATLIAKLVISVNPKEAS